MEGDGRYESYMGVPDRLLTDSQSSHNLAENSPNSVKPKLLDNWQKMLLLLVYHTKIITNLLFPLSV